MEDDLVDKQLVNRFFKHIRMQSNNRSCADCGKPSTIWTTKTHGFFICTLCAAKHRELGTGISAVKSTIMDTWMVSELRRMHVSGNAGASKLGRGADVRAKYTDAGWHAALVDELCAKSAVEEPGTSFIENLSEHSEELVPQKVAEKAMPRFSTASCEAEEDPVPARAPEEAVVKVDKPVSIKQNAFPALQKSGSAFNLQSDASSARKLGFGAAGLKDESDE